MEKVKITTMLSQSIKGELVYEIPVYDGEPDLQIINSEKYISVKNALMTLDNESDLFYCSKNEIKKYINSIKKKLLDVSRAGRAKIYINGHLCDFIGGMFDPEFIRLVGNEKNRKKVIEEIKSCNVVFEIKSKNLFVSLEKKEVKKYRYSVLSKEFITHADSILIDESSNKEKIKNIEKLNKFDFICEQMRVFMSKKEIAGERIGGPHIKPACKKCSISNYIICDVTCRGSWIR